MVRRGSASPFDIDTAMRRIEAAVAPMPKASMFALHEEGFDTVFAQLVACVISIRTREEDTLVCTRRLLGRAPTPEALLALDEREIDATIRESTFHERKAGQIREIARRTQEEHGGALPPERDLLISFDGVGPKCANLVLGIVGAGAYISVDVHVHRVTNRWGYVATKTPERTLAALEEKLPERHRVAINRFLVPFGRELCTRERPRCGACPVADMCAKVGVGARR